MLGMLLDMGNDKEARAARAEELRPKTLPEARVEHLRDVLKRQNENYWTAGDLVTPTKDSAINEAYVGEPHLVLAKRPVGSDPAAWEETVYIITVNIDGDVIGTWLAPWRIEEYKPKK